MTTVGTFEAKTHLTQLLGRVARGERILITNRGQPVAMLVPPEPEARGNVREIVREMLATRDQGGPTLGKSLTARQMREEGRRF
ncbi:MAG TPA: type II toxin-antitoxin system prevent-host-death family antitoxin [Gemmataceae bacterium]|nr:type II toxin-antitoxin system prevent-host-death family antitoxin [Gemmataceae bacterium]